jgi:predicted DNA-binding transcriptional regulator YafY
VADPLERLTNLIALLLETRRPLTLEEIADALAGQYPPGETARRGAFERDKALLRAEGVPIVTEVLAGTDAGRTGYRIDRDRYELHLDLAPDETRALQLAVATVRLGVAWGDDALLKLGAGPGPGGDGPVAALPSLPSLPLLFEANTARATVGFRYGGRERRLDPYGLLARNGFWYVVGHDHTAGDRRTYRVDRIEGGVTVGEPAAFVVPDGFDVAAALPEDPKTIGGGEAVALVEVAPLRAGKVGRELGEDAVTERRDDGTVVVRVPCANADAFRSWLLGFLDDAVVLGPPDVRAGIEEWLAAVVGGAPCAAPVARRRGGGRGRHRSACVGCSSCSRG